MSSGILRINMDHMSKWSVDQDNIRYYDIILRYNDSFFTLDTRGYQKYLDQFGIFYTLRTKA